MKHLKKMQQEELIIHTCDGDDNLTCEQSAQAFCMTPITPIPYHLIREAVLRHKQFPVVREGNPAVIKLAFEECLDRQISYWQMASIVNSLSIRQLIRQIKESNLTKR